MSTELVMLAWAVILGIAQIAFSAGLVAQRLGFVWAAGDRDDPRPDALKGVSGRLRRAQNNFLETFVFFAVAVLMVEVTGRHSPATLWGAQLYFWSRLIYVPLYALGTPYIRTLVWGISIVGLLMVLYGAMAGG
ncbi:putative MAPEG superfamily protein [Rhodoligotrophos appendicifer]|uniref:MAPEG family protein n=1 Tax=Rhodoligotrophos appendicifer TaxID=987056 RepID=UPI00117C7A71|nr:MAPEG family protein [Rhodoligotrophos appendicifer]